VAEAHELPSTTGKKRMARTKAPERKTASLNVAQMRSAIKKIERRITDLESFEVSSIRERFDPVVEALEKWQNRDSDRFLAR
jgi:hypothetical protein